MNESLLYICISTRPFPLDLLNKTSSNKSSFLPYLPLFWPVRQSSLSQNTPISWYTYSFTSYLFGFNFLSFVWIWNWFLLYLGPIQPIYLKIGPNRQCCLAGSSKMTPRILIFSIAFGADNSFYVKSIATYALTFFGYIISVLAIVYEERKQRNVDETHLWWKVCGN